MTTRIGSSGNKLYRCYAGIYRGTAVGTGSSESFTIPIELDAIVPVKAFIEFNGNGFLHTVWTQAGSFGAQPIWDTRAANTNVFLFVQETELLLSITGFDPGIEVDFTLYYYVYADRQVL